MSEKKTFNFIKPTLKFSLLGLFIPGFTAVLILGLQQGIELLGIECSQTWSILWSLTAIGSIAAPIVFIVIIEKKIFEDNKLKIKYINIFNIIEYIFIQCSLAYFFTNGKTLCYVTDGQNGIEFGFTGWMAIPILIVLSLIFDIVRKRAVVELKYKSKY
jgi:hypothetical protein